MGGRARRQDGSHAQHWHMAPPRGACRADAAGRSDEPLRRGHACGRRPWLSRAPLRASAQAIRTSWACRCWSASLCSPRSPRFLHLRETAQMGRSRTRPMCSNSTICAPNSIAPQVFLAAEPQIIIAWDGAGRRRRDRRRSRASSPTQPIARRVLGFGSWLPPESAQQLEACVERLRAARRGLPFQYRKALPAGTLELDGRADQRPRRHAHPRRLRRSA